MQNLASALQSFTFTIPITQKKKKTDLCLWVCGTLVGNRSLRETMKAMIENPSTRFMADGLSIGNGPAFSMLHLSPQYVMALFCS